MGRIIRLTESELSNLIKKVINEQKLLTEEFEEKHYDYTQKGAHFLIGKDGKGITLPVGTVWHHQGFAASMVDYLMEYKSNIIFHCGDLDYMFNQTGGKKPINLKDFKNSGPLIQQLKKERCLDGEWDYSKYSTYNPFR